MLVPGYRRRQPFFITCARRAKTAAKLSVAVATKSEEKKKNEVSRMVRAVTMAFVLLACCGHLRADLATVDIDRVVTTLQNNFAKILDEDLGASKLTVSEAETERIWNIIAICFI